MQLQSVTHLLNMHGIKLTTNNGKLAIKKSCGKIPDEIKRLINEREHDLISWLKQRDPIIHDVIPIKPISRTLETPASSVQKNWWKTNKKNHPNYINNQQISLKFKAKLKPFLLNHSLNELIKRHEMLRTVFKENKQGKLLQYIHTPYSMLIPLIPYEEVYSSNKDIDRRMNRLTLEHGQKCFDLEKGPLFRTALLQLPHKDSENQQKIFPDLSDSEKKSDEYIFLFSYHKIILDHRSCQLLLEQLISIYSSLTNNPTFTTPKSDIEYADYAHWETQWAKNKAFNRCQTYWENQLNHITPTPLLLPYDRPKTPSASHCAAREKWHISTETTTKLFTIGRNEKVSIYTLLLTTLQVLLKYHTGQNHIYIGKTVNNCPDQQLQQMIGPLAGQTIIHGHLSDEITFSHLLHKTHLSVTEALCLQPIAYGDLMAIVQARGWPKHSELCQVTLDIDYPIKQSPNKQFKKYSIEKKFLKACSSEISFIAQPTNNRIDGNITYQCDLFNRITIQNLLQQYQYLLKLAANNWTLKISELIAMI